MILVRLEITEPPPEVAVPHGLRTIYPPLIRPPEVLEAGEVLG